MVASLLAVTSIFGQNHNQGACTPQPPVCKPAKCCLPQVPQPPMNCAYNAPAEINVGCQGDIDFFASGSFLYWQPILENMSIAYVNTTNVFLAAPERSLQGSFVDMNFKYKPGFKVGLGMNLQVDDWDGFTEYTRVHGEHRASTNGGPDANVPMVYPTFGHPFLLSHTIGASAVFNSASATYNNNLDFVDAEMGRTYYVGKSLIFRSAWGARGSWITQHVHVNYNNFTSLVATDPAGVIVSINSSVDVYQRQRSWGVGPRTGLMMDWMLGQGVRFFGSGYGDILYHKFKIQDKTVAIPRINRGSLLIGNPISVVSYEKVGALRTHLDLEMGFGWGSYFDNNNWHIDLSASYGWQVFFDHNMFRSFTDDFVIGNNHIPNGNLYVHGLTVTARVDF